MKKTLFLMLFALIGVMANAQNLASQMVGKWTADVTKVMEEEAIKSGTITLTLNSNGTNTVAWNFDMKLYEDNVEVEMSMTLSFPSTWKVSGNNLNMYQDKEHATADITRFLMGGEDFMSFAGLVKDELADQMKESLSEYTDFPLENIKLSIDGKSFTCDFGEDDIMTFRKVTVKK